MHCFDPSSKPQLWLTGWWAERTGKGWAPSAKTERVLGNTLWQGISGRWGLEESGCEVPRNREAVPVAWNTKQETERSGRWSPLNVNAFIAIAYENDTGVQFSFPKTGKYPYRRTQSVLCNEMPLKENNQRRWKKVDFSIMYVLMCMAEVLGDGELYSCVCNKGTPAACTFNP